MWIGVPNHAMEDICPNMDNFDASYFFDANDLFEGIPPPPPTSSPTSSPPTSNPTDQPSLITSSPTTKVPTTLPPTAGPSETPTLLSPQPSTGPTTNPTFSPTAFPTFSPNCLDESNYLLKGEKGNSCIWAGKDQTRVSSILFDLIG